MEKKQKQTEEMEAMPRHGHGMKGFRVLMVALLAANIAVSAHTSYVVQGLKSGAADAIRQVEEERAGGKEMYDLILQYQKLSAGQQKSQIEAAIKQLGGTVSAGDTSNNANTAAAPSADASKSLSDDEYAQIMKDSYVEGKKDAKITLVEYSDLECPYCIMQTKNKTIAKLQEKYGDSVNVIYKPLNLARHPGSDQKGWAALCVAQLGGTDKYSKFYHAVLEGSNVGGPVYPLDNIKSLAKQVGVDATKFAACYDGKKTEDLYKSYTTEALKFGVDGTPTTMILNNQTKKYDLVKGAADVSSFYPVVDKLMK